MPLIANSDLPTFNRLADEGLDVLSLDRAHSQDIRELHIGLLNMMPDAALQATERQFLRLVTSCNRIAQFYVHPISVPGLERQGEVGEYVAQFYEEPDAVLSAGLDALIISGANPVHADIREEPYWDALYDIMQWANDNVTSTMCSCLATHAHIAQTHGVERTPLRDKQWGVYSHRVLDANHPLTANINTRFDAPHSRWNDVPRTDLESVGIRVLAESEEAGVQLATSRDGVRWVYFQGHPEYDVQSLLKEYKREVNRYIDGVHATFPPRPEHYFTPAAGELLATYQAEAEAAKAKGTDGPSFPEAAIDATLENTWTDTGKALFNNWLGMVYQLTGARRDQPFMPGIDPNAPLD
ncbi:MAG: homoserine O-succinyltransferase [Chromatiales bacterium]|jgi:homoserine O-succinyltransferase/O-acetyltransferase|nr:homoserine O-succinyltransferase [Chromatiales bacterium]